MVALPMFVDEDRTSGHSRTTPEEPATSIEIDWTDIPRTDVRAPLGGTPVPSYGMARVPSPDAVGTIAYWLLQRRYDRTFALEATPPFLPSQAGWALAQKLSGLRQAPPVMSVDEEELVEPPNDALWEGVPASRWS